MQDNPADVWSQVKVILAEEISPSNLDIWLGEVALQSLRDGEALLEVPNRYYGDWILDNYQAPLARAFGRVLGRPAVVRVIETEGRRSSAAADPDVEDASSNHRRSGPDGVHTFGWKGRPNPEKRFENFVVGPCNDFAHGAAQAVADFPGGVYNPLFMFGGSGLGKTHLLHAVGNAILKSTPTARMVYVTAEQFMTDMVSALRFNRMPEFRERYRNQADVLLVDDVQFLGGKRGTQDEFFHTFESLLNSGRQIVMTADMLPRDIEGLEDRLKTRFASGLNADLMPPDLETMLAILHKKAEELGLKVPPDAALYIATGVGQNIRELEGALKLLAALMAMYNEPLTHDTVVRRLPHLRAPERPVVTPDGVLRTVARIHNVKIEDLKGPSHQKSLVRPRHLAIFLIREHTELSFPDIGRFMGGRDSSTVQYACRKMADMRRKDPDVAAILDLLEKNLKV